MKSRHSLLPFVCASLTLAASASADIIAQEYFNGYGDADKAFVNSFFDGGSAGLGWGSDWGDTTEVINNVSYIEANGYAVGDSLAYSTTGYDDSANLSGANDGAAGSLANTDGAGTYSFSARMFSTPSTATTIWFSVLVNGGASSQNAVLWIDAENVSKLYGGLNGFGILNGNLFMRTQLEGGGSTEPDRVTVTGAAATASTTYLILAKAEINYDTEGTSTFDRLQVWVDPDLSDGENNLGAETFLNEGRNLWGDTMTGISVQTVGDSNVDAVRVGTTLTDVTTAMVPVAPEVTSITKSGSTVTVEFTGAEGQQYGLNKTTNLDFSTPNIVNTTAVSGGTGTLQDTNATESAAFYRVESQ